MKTRLKITVFWQNILCLFLSTMLMATISQSCIALSGLSSMGNIGPSSVNVALGVAVAGDYAYVADGDSNNGGGLKIINMADPANPTLTGSLALGSNTAKIAVNGNYAYVADRSYGLYIVDVSNPASPVQVSSVDTGETLSIAARDNYLYLYGDGKLNIFDVSNPANPVLIGLLDLYPPYPGVRTEGKGWGIAVDGDYVYIGGLSVINVSNPAAPVLVSSLKLADPRGVSVSDGYAYVASGSTGLQIVNVSDPATPILVKDFLDSGIFHVEEVKKVGDYVYVVGYGLLSRINVVNPAEPFLECCNNPWYAPSKDLAVIGVDHVYVAADNSGLYAMEMLPVVTAIPKSGKEDTILTFSATDFTDHFSSRSSLVKIQIKSLPSNGTLKLSEAVVVDQEIVAENLGDMTFVPDANWSGSTSFSWNGSNEAAYAATAANVDIDIEAQEAPTVSTVPKSGTEDTTLTFSATDFANHFADPDGKDLAKIQIESLPGHGDLRLLGIEVVVDQEIVVEDLDNLVFDPDINWSGNTSFSWRGSNGAEYSSNTASVDIDIAAAQDAPTVSDISKTGTEDVTLTFSEGDFTSHFTDPDWDSLTKIQIMSLPIHGTLKLDGIAVVTNQEIVDGDLGKLTFNPETNWNGNTSFSWQGFDGTEYSSNTANVDITIAASQDAPTVSTIPKSGTEDTVVTFSEEDFTSHFTDVDGDSLTKIQVVNLPNHGTLKLDETTVTANQEIVSGNLGKLTFDPEKNWSGNASFSWKGSDGTEYSSNAANVDITIAASQDAPTVSTIPKSGTEDTVVTFSEEDFISHFADVDGDSLTKIRIVSLSGHGSLKLSGVAVTANQEVVFGDLGKLTFDPDTNWNGKTSLSWKGSDGTEYSSNTASINISIAAAQDAPTVSDISKTGTEDTVLRFSAANFTNHFSDPDGDSLTKIKVTSLPGHGILKLSGTAVTAGQEIVAGDLDNIAFDPDINWSGNTSFSWKGFDGIEYSNNMASVDISMTAAPDPPIVSDISKTGTEDTVLRFSATDFTNHFSDPDGDSLTKIQIMNLPGHGTLKLSGVSVIANQEIVAGDLDNIAFDPDINWSGNTSFSWKGFDGIEYSSNMASVDISMTAASDPPIVSDISKTGVENEILPFSATDFTSHFTDPDRDSLTKIKVVSLPSHGTLRFVGSAVVADQEIVKGSLGNLTFVPEANWGGKTSFPWKGYDGIQYSTNMARVNIDIIREETTPSNSEETSPSSMLGSSKWAWLLSIPVVLMW